MRSSGRSGAVRMLEEAARRAGNCGKEGGEQEITKEDERGLLPRSALSPFAPESLLRSDVLPLRLAISVGVPYLLCRDERCGGEEGLWNWASDTPPPLHRSSR